MSLCGLKKKSYKVIHTVSAIKEGKSVQRQPSSISKFTEEFYSDDPCASSSHIVDDSQDKYSSYSSYVSDKHRAASPNELEQYSQYSYLRRTRSFDVKWAREDQLSVILESLSETGSRRENDPPTWDNEDLAEALDYSVRTTATSYPKKFHGFKKTRFIDQDIPEYEYYAPEPDNMSDIRSPDLPKPIAPPPKDLESIARVDASLIFEHFTTNDAWELGSALRNRLLPIPTPVVINISLANQNQTLFHTCTHSGVMPDNDSWVARKRKTVLRWGCSTWYMHCKFGGDELAFRDKYGLGNDAGQYAIHGGGVPIRVTGVEGVVAVVVVSGLKQDEDHAVVVEVIRELYY